MPISKTDFVRGLQCEKMLWLDAHCPQERIIPEEVQAKLNAGNDFGDKAMGIFGEFVETTCLKEDGRLHYSAMIEKTQTLLQNKTPVICEAAFSWYGNYCAADILRKDGDKYALYEVKNTFHVRKEFITDLGFQRLILRKSGVPLSASFLILRGDAQENEAQFPQNDSFNFSIENKKYEGQVCVEYINYDNFTYKIVDVTQAAIRMEKKAEKEIFTLGKLKRKDAPCPLVSIGEHCDSPDRCWYYDVCRKKYFSQRSSFERCFFDGSSVFPLLLFYFLSLFHTIKQSQKSRKRRIICPKK